jgi:hypothetical protein
LLRAAGIASEIREAGEHLECVVSEADLPRIPPLLVGEDIELLELTPMRESLESVYIAEYGEDKQRMIE